MATPASISATSPSTSNNIVQPFVVFYSWQSDLPGETNQALIREALRSASTQLESTYSGAHIKIDEATRDMPGSPNIPQTILEKICAADAFVADMTTINKTRPDGQRACPNPNVLFELGYAVAHLGWNRVILLFNKAYGSFPNDVPFDIDRQRLSAYEYSLTTGVVSSETKKQKAARIAELKRPLLTLVHDALNAIYIKRHPKPSQGDDFAPKKRTYQHDTDKLHTLLSSIHLPTLDDFFERLREGAVPSPIFSFWENFNATVTSSLFDLYDRKAKSLVEAFHGHWGKSLNFGRYFHPSPGGTFCFFEGPEKAQKELQQAGAQAEQALRRLLAHVRKRYLTIDISETSNVAWHEYVESQNKMRLSFEKEKQKPK